MKRIFSLILFVIISNKAIASVKGETLICDKDTRGYNFISKDEVKISGINLNKCIHQHKDNLVFFANFLNNPCFFVHVRANP